MDMVNKKTESYVANTAASTSPVIDLTQGNLLSVHNNNTTTSITFYAAPTATGSYGILSYNGTAMTIATTTANACYAYDKNVFDGVKYLKIVKGTAAGTLTLIKDIK
jgi:hypothetical protein